MYLILVILLILLLIGALAHLAVQRQLGLLPERRSGVDSVDHPDRHAARGTRITPTEPSEYNEATDRIWNRAIGTQKTSGSVTGHARFLLGSGVFNLRCDAGNLSLRLFPKSMRTTPDSFALAKRVVSRRR